MENDHGALTERLSAAKTKQGQPMFEVHTWEKLSPFSTIVSVVDLLTFTVKLMLIGIVLISILNVMTMSVYERISEIGTISAIGTPPSKISALFLAEGLILGLGSTLLGVAVGVAALFVINVAHVRFSFGRMKDIVLETSISPYELLTVSLVVVLVTLLASLQPALKASKMDPVVALRHV